MKLYQSEKWLRQKYLRERKSIEEIMALTGASRKTIYIYINKFGIKR